MVESVHRYTFSGLTSTNWIDDDVTIRNAGSSVVNLYVVVVSLAFMLLMSVLILKVVTDAFGGWLEFSIRICNPNYLFIYLKCAKKIN